MKEYTQIIRHIETLILQNSFLVKNKCDICHKRDVNHKEVSIFKDYKNMQY